MDAVLGLGLLVLGVFVYFLPGIVAHMRGHHQENAIVLLNLFLGWTFIGWVAALVWSATAVQSVALSGDGAQTRPAAPLFPKLIVGLLLLGVLAIGGGYLGYTMMRQEIAKDDRETPPSPAVSQAAEPTAQTTTYLPVDSMVVDLADKDESRVAQIGVTLALRSKSAVSYTHLTLPTSDLV